MATIAQITEHIIRDAAASAIQNVVKTMMGLDASLDSSMAVGTPGPSFDLIANVGFTGEANGVVYLCMDDDFARFATGRILGMSPGEVSMHGAEVVNDAMGELTNMSAGGFKNQLCDLGFPCKLTLPTIVRGKELRLVALKGSVRHIFTFDCAGQSLLVDIQLKSG